MQTDKTKRHEKFHWGYTIDFMRANPAHPEQEPTLCSRSSFRFDTDSECFGDMLSAQLELTKDPFVSSILLKSIERTYKLP